MKSILIFLLGLLFTGPSLSAQWHRAFVQPDGSVGAKSISSPAEIPLSWRKEGFSQLSGFPKSAAAHPGLKNFRNVTLSYLDDQPGIDILWGANERLLAHNADTLIWEKPLTGVAIYPPSAMGESGNLFAQATGLNGRVYLFDRDGQDLPGWPRNFNDHWMAAAPTLADVDRDGSPEVIVNELVSLAGFVHILRLDGTEFSNNWPVPLDARPAVTPSVGDVDGDGELDIVVHSTQSRWVFGLDGLSKAGWPITTGPRQRYSFQSPVLAPLDGAGLSIIGATHGDPQLSRREPLFYIDQPDGAPRPGWPIPIPERSWTFNTPTVLPLSEEKVGIFYGRPLGAETGADAMLFGFDQDGQMLPGFPIVKPGGLEGIISAADVDDDTELELLFGSTLIDTLTGRGFLHAYELDGSGEVPGFPLRPRGFTFMNGASLGDVNGDGQLELVALSYTTGPTHGADSIYLNVYELGLPANTTRIAWNTYKGNNSRQGLVEEAILTARSQLPIPELQVTLSPNPAQDQCTLELNLKKPVSLEGALHAADGRLLRTLFRTEYPIGHYHTELDLKNLPPGVYWVILHSKGCEPVTKRLVVE